jgi:hypothetical protein
MQIVLLDADILGLCIVPQDISSAPLRFSHVPGDLVPQTRVSII